MTAINAATALADAELTAHCINAFPGECFETNPLYGPRPGRARIYAISLSMFGLQTAISYLLKRHSPEKKTWLIPAIAGTASHGVGTIYGLRNNFH